VQAFSARRHQYGTKGENDMDDDPDIRGRLIDLYTRYGDKLTADQAAERGVSAEDHATFMMDMADEHRRERETLAEAAKTPPPDPEQIPPRRSPDEVRRIEEGEAERQETHERWRRASEHGETEWQSDDED
jgi:hypothetical protein